MKKILTIIITILFLSFPGKAQVDHVLKARSLMKVERYDSALHYLSLAEQSRPGDADIHYFRGICNFELRRYNEALSDFIFVNKRTSGKANLMLAKTEARLHHPELAIKYLREHLTSYYKLPEKDILLDEDLMLLENTTAWRKLWQEQEWYSAYDRELQEIEYQISSGNTLNAINELNQLREKGFKRSKVNQYLAELYLESGNNKAAMDAVNRAVSANSRNSDALNIRITLMEKKGAFDEASRDCERLLRQDPDEFDYYLVSGKLLSGNGEYQKALDRVNMYLEFYPDSHKALNTLGEVHFENNKYLDALKAFNRALAMEDGVSTYYFNRGKTYAATGTYRYAASDFSMALDLEPDNPEIWFEKGLTDIELEEIQTACFDFRKAFQYGKYEAKEFIDRLCINNHE